MSNILHVSGYIEVTIGITIIFAGKKITDVIDIKVVRFEGIIKHISGQIHLRRLVSFGLQINVLKILDRLGTNRLLNSGTADGERLEIVGFIKLCEVEDLLDLLCWSIGE